MMRKGRRWAFGGVAAALATSVFAGLLGRSSDAATPDAAAAAPASATASGDARVTTVATFLNKHCVACHNPEKHKADLTLQEYVSQPAILKGRKVLSNALKMVHAGEMPPEGKAQPSQPELDAFFAAISGIFSDIDRSAAPDPGRVTVRRLNRTEYNNTIRDLLGVETNAADDFPTDDIGHGFDNIGDVLTVSPVLMERYLAAAEFISAATIALEPPKPVNRSQYNKYLEPAGPKVPADRFRPLPKGALNTPFRLATDGEYVLRTQLYAKNVDDEKAKATLLVDGKELTTVEVTGTKEKPQTIRYTLKLEPGEHRFAVALANPSEGAEELDVGNGGRRAFKNAQRKGEKPEPAKVEGNFRSLNIEHIALEGPADTRPKAQRVLMSYADASAPHATQIRQILTKFLARAYRRPATKDEVERLAKLVEETEAGGEKFEAGLQLAVQAALVSPKFLFRLELDDRPTTPQPRMLDDYALANRLSYFLWASMPDDELFDLASKKELSKNLEPQVQRMLKDPRAKQTLVNDFAMQWLQLKRLRSFTPDQKVFPQFDEQLRTSMQKETELFLSAIVDEDRSILDLINGDFTFLNERLAKHYNIGDTNGNTAWVKPERQPGQKIPYEKWVRVSLLPDGPRGGILTQASVLAVTSNPGRTSPVKRGKWILEQILGTPPPPPPANVPPLEDNGKAITDTSLRKRLELHRANPACANCHAKMDPIGFAFENFNSLGGWREKDGNFKIDPSGVLPDGKKVNGPQDLRAVLMEKKDLFTRALSEKLLIYAIGRGTEYYDDTAIDKIAANTAKDGYKFSRLVMEIVKSDPFIKRRGTASN